MIYLKKITFENENKQGFPYDLAFFNQEIQFNKPITILIGDNGCGKSTLLDLIKEALGFYQIGTPFNNFPKVKCQYDFKKTPGFYFTSEDFTSYIYALEKEIMESEEALREVDESYKMRSVFAKNQAKAPYQKTIYEIKNLHDRNLFTASHGQAYLSFFNSRLRPKHVILLDEPESPLSFTNQLSLLYSINEAVKENTQFIIATHSPLIMALPNAQILEFSEGKLIEVAYSDIENVRLMKEFLNNPDRFLKHLFD